MRSQSDRGEHYPPPGRGNQYHQSPRQQQQANRGGMSRVVVFCLWLLSNVNASVFCTAECVSLVTKLFTLSIFHHPFGTTLLIYIHCLPEGGSGGNLRRGGEAVVPECPPFKAFIGNLPPDIDARFLKDDLFHGYVKICYFLSSPSPIYVVSCL